ncbi:hypothetical protein AVEN_59013-1 [Araneus ventricosus]|uniref:Uncharacterized protein n=1 Tax=Araneus ventricosus TaxID=182803 RepID=A0A4Y2QRY0_ARAVE|nr:hypothetical protein AVEN_59013-1 [Araneus ventricosus]
MPKEGHSQSRNFTSFHAHHDKTLRQCKDPMRIGVDRGKVWKSNVVRFPFGVLGHKSEIRSFGWGGCSHQTAKTTHGERGIVDGSQSGEIKARACFESGGRRGSSPG